ncbi:MAG: haloacid dehalogenase type II [Alphaproteobacteria bacterium]|nr:haloacid dehalogenase type II [Alphaproteobacteria bacterium]
MPRPVRALAFDVFGTVVDWRSSIARQAEAILTAAGVTGIDPFDFADRWRARYPGAVRASNEAGRGFVLLDVIHRETLDRVLGDLDLALGEPERAALVACWHRLDPWPDAAEGLRRLRALVPVAACSNGHVALIVTMTRHGGLVWDAVLGAEFAGAYKPAAITYQSTAAALGIEPGELMMVAAHHADLAAARAAGLQCAFVSRPMEYGGRPAPDAAYAQEWELSVTSFLELADALPPLLAR